jgi:hypothetical protein
MCGKLFDEQYALHTYFQKYLDMPEALQVSACINYMIKLRTLS